MSADAYRINALANEAMESIYTDDAEDYASARGAIELVIEKAIAQLTAELAERDDQVRGAQRETRDVIESLRRSNAERDADHAAGFRAGVEAAAAVALVPQGHYQVGMSKLPWWSGEKIAEAILALATKETGDGDS